VGHNNTTYGNELDEVGKRLFEKKWGGVHSADTLPRLVKGKFYISNVDNSNEDGSHWVGIYDGYIYDSFGRSAREMNKNLTGHGLKKTDDDQEQGYTQTNCGQRALAWLLVATEQGINVSRKI
jgi:hypothetical protein